MVSDFKLIDKETVKNLSFPLTEVLQEHEAILQRKKDLERALSLGNLERVKIKIYFEDNEGMKLVDTTIWGVTDERIILKQGVVIPTNRIHKII